MARLTQKRFARLLFEVRWENENGRHSVIVSFCACSIVFVCLFQDCTYSTPAKREESVVLMPDVCIDVKETSGHYKYPCGKIYRIQCIIEYNRFASAQRQNTCHYQRDAKRNQIWRSTCNFPRKRNKKEVN